MKRILHSCFLFFALFISGSAFSQAFWTETFGAGPPCGSGTPANVGVPTPTNGAWTIAITGPNDPDANQWYISAEENGNAVGACGSGCGNNRTLHIGNVSTSPSAPFACPAGDCGAAYDAGFGLGDVATDKRAESPTINCTGKVNITLTFKYLTEGDPGNDFAELFYFDGAVWNNLGVMAITNNALCIGQGLWTAFSVALPASANNNPAVKVGFHWINNDDATGTDPSIAVDDVVLSTSAALTITTAITACTNQTVTGTITSTVAGATSYSWASVPAGAVFNPNNTTATNVAITYPSPGTYSIIVGAFNPLPFAVSNTIVVNVTATPTINVAPASQTICTGATATITANGATTYTWNTAATTSVINVSPAANTNYTVVGSNGSCTAAAVATVVVANSLAISAGASSPSVCPGSAVTLTASGAATYTWVAPPSTTISTTSTALANPTVATTYTVFVTSGTCNGNLTVQVGMSSGLTLTVAASSATVCPGQTTTLTATGALNYTWSPGSSLSTTSGSVTNASPNTQTTYTVLGDNGAGCTGTANITINMGAGASIGVSATASAVCTGFTSTLTAIGATSYTWTGTTLTTSIVQPSISVGPGTYTVLGSTGAGCNSFSVITINLAPPLNVQVTQSSFTTCMASNYPQFSKPVTLNATGASQYNWSQCNPTYMTICIGPTITVRPPTSTCYTVTGSTSVCSGSAVVCVTVIPQFTMAVTPTQPIICLGDSIILKTTSIGTLAVLPIPSATNANGYVWTEPANAPPPSLDNPLSGTVTAYPLNTCTYTFEIYDARACVSLPRLITVTVLPKPLTSIAIPTINNVATNTVCFVGLSPGAPDNTITLTGNNNNVGLPFGVVPTYTWSSGYLQPPCNSQSILTPQNSNSVIVNAPCRLPSLVTYTLLSGYNGIPGCRRIDTVTIRGIDCRPVRNIQFQTATVNDTICSRTCVTFINQTDTMAGGPQTYTWTFPGGSPSTSTLTNPTVCYNLPSNPSFNVVLTVANPYPIPTGSQLTAYRNKYITVVDIPNVTIIPPGQYISDTTIRFGQCVVLKATGAKRYEWNSSYQLSNSLTSPNVTVCPQHNYLYYVKGWNSSQCASADSINVIVVEDCGEMFVPNAFSPNNDGANDVLYVRGQCLETLTFMVFNRWGQKVFETTDKNIGWDGTFKGDIMNTGVFVYRLEGKDYAGKGYSMKGNVTLIR
ncbi:MAG: gliding motility-associated C-terminal domain-containing protein [Bacteroidetes bacterium]|nr:gliding motility-associated C-terminal domain-containing protein [Bacteroidota bacterium]